MERDKIQKLEQIICEIEQAVGKKIEVLFVDQVNGTERGANGAVPQKQFRMTFRLR